MFPEWSSHETGLLVNVWRHKVALKLRELLPWHWEQYKHTRSGKVKRIEKIEKWRHSMIKIWDLQSLGPFLGKASYFGIISSQLEDHVPVSCWSSFILCSEKALCFPIKAPFFWWTSPSEGESNKHLPSWLGKPSPRILVMKTSFHLHQDTWKRSDATYWNFPAPLARTVQASSLVCGVKRETTPRYQA